MMPIGIVANRTKDTFQADVIRGIQQVIDPKDTQVFSLDQGQLSLENLGGLIVVADALPDRTLQNIYEQGLPISLISHSIPQLPSMMFNHAQGIALLSQHLVEACHRRQILFVRGLPQQVDAQQRELAFRQEMMRHHIDLPESYFLRGDFNPPQACQALDDFLQLGLPFDAILAADFQMALALMDRLAQHRIQIPAEVAVVAFGDAHMAEKAGLTVVAANVQELGRRSARQLLCQLRGLRIRGTTTLNVELVIRQSSGAAR